jgi:hypothetical protein
MTLKIGIQSDNIILQNHVVQESDRSLLHLMHKASNFQMIADNIKDYKSTCKVLHEHDFLLNLPSIAERIILYGHAS